MSEEVLAIVKLMELNISNTNANSAAQLPSGSVGEILTSANNATLDRSREITSLSYLNRNYLSVLVLKDVP